MIEEIIESVNMDWEIKEQLYSMSKRYKNLSEFILVVKDTYWKDEEGVEDFLNKIDKIFKVLYGFQYKITN